MTSFQKLGFYATPPHRCNYLYDQQAVTLFADPNFPKTARLYSALSSSGFRRSGTHLYIPNCGSCTACIPVRVAAEEFQPSRNQRRAWKNNDDIQVAEIPAVFRQDHFDLYGKYLAVRHPEGGMDNPTPETYMDFLTSSWTDTVFYEMRVSGKLVAVAVTDILEDALSAVYTFFDPAESRRSLGRYAILYQLAQVKARGLAWLYLGYWIKQCDKMNYKAEYLPQQVYINNKWYNCYNPPADESTLPD
jgi:arginyl-tRNA--protein-N-Asp/Glu arginylyltransferase